MLYIQSKWFIIWTANVHIAYGSQVNNTLELGHQDAGEVNGKKAVTGIHMDLTWHRLESCGPTPNPLFPGTWLGISQQPGIGMWPSDWVLISGMWAKWNVAHLIKTSYEQSSTCFLLLLANLAEPQDGKNLGFWTTAWRATHWSFDSPQVKYKLLFCK